MLSDTTRSEQVMQATQPSRPGRGAVPLL